VKNTPPPNSLFTVKLQIEVPLVANLLHQDHQDHHGNVQCHSYLAAVKRLTRLTLLISFKMLFCVHLNYTRCCSMSEKTRLQNTTHPFRQRIEKPQLSQTNLKLSNSVVYSHIVFSVKLKITLVVKIFLRFLRAKDLSLLS